MFPIRRLLSLQVPLRVVALEVVGGEGGGGVACRIETVAGVEALLSGDGAWHEAVGAVGELFDAPELAVVARKGGDSGEFTIGRRCESTVGSCDGDFVVGTAQVAARIGHGSDGPVLVWTEHIVGAAHADFALRPGGTHLFEL